MEVTAHALPPELTELEWQEVGEAGGGGTRNGSPQAGNNLSRASAFGVEEQCKRVCLFTSLEGGVLYILFKPGTVYGRSLLRSRYLIFQLV